MTWLSWGHVAFVLSISLSLQGDPLHRNHHQGRTITNFETLCDSTKTHRQASLSISVAHRKTVGFCLCQSPNHHHHFPAPGEKGKAGTGRKLEFTGFALSNTAGGKGRGTLQGQRHTAKAEAHYKGRGTLQGQGQAGTKLFWCHILEHSAAM